MPPGWMSIYGWWHHPGLLFIVGGLIAMGLINP